MLQGSITNILQNWHFFLSLWIIQGAFTVLTLWLMSDALLDKDVISVLSFLGGILGFTLFSLVITIGKNQAFPSIGNSYYSHRFADIDMAKTSIPQPYDI